MSRPLRTDPCPAHVVAYLRQSVPRATRSSAPVVAVAALAPGVWRVERQDGEVLVAKHQLFGALGHHAPHDLLEVERLVLGHLHDRSCAVPAVRGIDPDSQVIFLEWLGARTLDDWAQEASAAQRSSVIGELVRGYWLIDAALVDITPAMAWRTAPGCDEKSLLSAWDAATACAQRALHGLLVRTDDGRAAEAALHRICASCRARPPHLGTADYNARNVVLTAADAPCFIEFATLSWDWPERRLVQYATPLGAGREDGSFIGLLNSAASAECKRGGGDSVALDQHYLVFLLNASERLDLAVSRSEETSPGSTAARAELWTSRREQLRQLLLCSLSSDPDTRAVRECLGRAFLHGSALPGKASSPRKAASPIIGDTP